MGEGAGIVVLEERERAQARGARIYAELVGYGMSSDAYHISTPAENGDGIIRAMKAALKDAGVAPEQIDYINAHGTSTPSGDPIEILAAKAVFGDHARKLAISSTKSMTGHLLGAAGGVEAASPRWHCTTAVLPPTINLDNQDPECDLDCVPNEARKAQVRVRAVQLVRLRRHQRRAHHEAARGLSKDVRQAMKILVCVKQVPDTETRVRIAPDGAAIVESDINWVVSPYDEFAIEEALRLREAKGGEVVLLSLGADRVQTALRTGLAMGADSAVHVKDPRSTRHAGGGTRPRRRDPQDRRVRPVLTGQQGVGGDNSQMPGLLAELLDLPQVTTVVKLEIRRGHGEGRARGRGRRGSVGNQPARGRLGAEGPERAALREPQGHHGGEEEDDRELGCRGTRPRPRRTCSRTRASPRWRCRRSRGAVKMIDGDADAQVKELLRLLHEEAKVI